MIQGLEIRLYNGAHATYVAIPETESRTVGSKESTVLPLLGIRICVACHRHGALTELAQDGQSTFSVRLPAFTARKRCKKAQARLNSAK